MSWINTYTGKKVFPLDLTEDQVAFRDVVRNLNGKRRFQGASEVTVARHSVAVARVFEAMGGKNVLKALLHDADETYLPDVPHPMKVLPEMAWFLQVAVEHERVIDQALKVGKIHAADARLLSTIDRVASDVEASVFLTRNKDWVVTEAPAAMTDLVKRELLAASGQVFEIWARDLGVKG